MKNKKIYILIIICCICAISVYLVKENNAPKMQDDMSQMETVTIPPETQTSTTMEDEDAESNWTEAIVESTPDSITYEIKEKNSDQSAKVELGVGENGVDTPDAPDITPEIFTTPAHQETEPMKTEPNIPEVPPASSEPQPEYAYGPEWGTTYEEYEAMSTQERLLFRYSFVNDDEFWKWFDVAKAEYEAKNNDIIIGDGGMVDGGDK